MISKIPKIPLKKKIINFITVSKIKVSKKRKLNFLFDLLALLILLGIKNSIINFKLETQLFTILLNILLLYFSTHILLTIIRSSIVSLYRNKHKYPADHQDNLTVGLDKIYKIIFALILFFLGLFYIGIDLNIFLTTSALFGVALAIIFKEILTNIVDGVIIMFTNEVKLKEYIQVGEYRGRVTNLNFLNLELKTDDGNVIYIPNSKIMTNEITNLSKSSIKRITYNFYLDFAFFGKVDKLEKQLSKALSEEFPEILKPEDINLTIIEIRSTKVDLKLLINVPRYNFSIEGKILKFTSKYILNFIQKEKTPIASEVKRE